MKTKLLIFLLLGATACAQTFQVDTAEAQPWWEQVDQTQALLLKWITALSIVLTALFGAAFTIWALVKNKMAELSQRQDRLVDEKRSLQTQINAVAIATDPTKTSSGRPTRVEVVNKPSDPVPTIEKKP